MIFKNYNEVVDYVIKKFPKEPPCNTVTIKKSSCQNLEYNKLVESLYKAGYNIKAGTTTVLVKDKYLITKI